MCLSVHHVSVCSILSVCMCVFVFTLNVHFLFLASLGKTIAIGKVLKLVETSG